MQGTENTLYIHIGRGWIETLAQIGGTSAEEIVYRAAAYVDLALGTHVVFRLDRPVRLLPFVFSWIEALARALKSPGRRFVVGDGDDLMWVQTDGDDIVLADEGQRVWLPRRDVLVALRATMEALGQELAALPQSDLCVPIHRQIIRADRLVERMMTAARQRGSGRLHTSSSLRLADDETPVMPPAERRCAVGELPRAPSASHRGFPAVSSLQFLVLSHRRTVRIPPGDAHAAFFDTNRDFVLLCGARMHLIDPYMGTHREIGPEACAEVQEGWLSHIGECVLFSGDDGVVVLHPLGGWHVGGVLRGVRKASDVRALVLSGGEVLAYLRGETVFDAPTGVALLHEISQLLERYDADGRVVGWYALNRARTAVWSDRNGPPESFVRLRGRAVDLRTTRHGIVVYECLEGRLTLRWFDLEGSPIWTRALTSHSGRFRGQRSLSVYVGDADRRHLCVSVVSGAQWWAFRIHTVTQLATLVAHRHERGAVRLEWADEALLVASGEHLAAYPLDGRQPDPIWTVRVPATLGVMTPVFPLCVRGELVAYATDGAIVRRIRDGVKLASYEGDWTALFDIRLHADMGLVIAAAVPGHSIDLYAAMPTQWLGVVR